MREPEVLGEKKCEIPSFAWLTFVYVRPAAKFCVARLGVVVFRWVDLLIIISLTWVSIISRGTPIDDD